MSNTIPSAPSSSKVNFSIAILLSVVATSPPGRKLHLPLTLYLSDYLEKPSQKNNASRLKRRAVVAGALLFQFQLVFVLFYERINRLRLLLKLST